MLKNWVYGFSQGAVNARHIGLWNAVLIPLP